MKTMRQRDTDKDSGIQISHPPPKNGCIKGILRVIVSLK